MAPNFYHSYPESNLAFLNAGGAGAAIDNAVNAASIALGAGMSRSKSDTSLTTYNNSTLTASNGTVKINSIGTAGNGPRNQCGVTGCGGDTAIKGANLLAKDITLNTQGNLTVESLQNSYQQKGNSRQSLADK